MKPTIFFSIDTSHKNMHPCYEYTYVLFLRCRICWTHPVDYMPHCPFCVRTTPEPCRYIFLCQCDKFHGAMDLWKGGRHAHICRMPGTTNSWSKSKHMARTQRRRLSAALPVNTIDCIEYMKDNFQSASPRVRCHPHRKLRDKIQRGRPRLSLSAVAMPQWAHYLLGGGGGCLVSPQCRAVITAAACTRRHSLWNITH